MQDSQSDNNGHYSPFDLTAIIIISRLLCKRDMHVKYLSVTTATSSSLTVFHNQTHLLSKVSKDSDSQTILFMTSVLS